MTTAAVITADIVNWTRLAKSDARALIEDLEQAVQPHPHQFYRGDSFQVLVHPAAEALTLLLRLRAIAMKAATVQSMPVSDIRASIAVGPVRLPVKTLSTAEDEAFVVSGRSLDTIKDDRLLIQCITGNNLINAGLGVASRFIDHLFSKLTAKQAAVVFELLQGHTQVTTAKRLRKSQATIHKHAQAAGWPQLERLLADYLFFIQNSEG